MEELAAQKANNYQADIPIKNPDQDKFGRAQYAKRIAETVINRTDPSNIVIGIYGPWGDGKSSMINLVNYELLRHPDKVIPIFFNPWRVKDENQLIMQFFAQLGHILDEKIEVNSKKIFKRGDKLSEAITKYATTILPVDIGIPGATINAGQTIANISSLFSKNDPDSLKKRIDKALIESNKKIVVFMDDIDRLEKSEIHTIFKLVKLTAGFSNICYILAFDDQMVATALSERYGNSEKDINAGYSFLEKIVQIPIRSPQIPRFSLLQFFEKEVLNALNDSGITFSKHILQPFWRIVIDDLSVVISTPRMCKRYSNVIRFAATVLKGEVNVVDLLLIEAIRIWYPKLYNSIRDNGKAFLAVTKFLESEEQLLKQANELMNQSLEHLSEKEQNTAKLIVSYLFPQTKSYVEGMKFNVPIDEAWRKGKHISSKEYFQRYFSYSVPEDDISDIAIDNFLASISKLDDKKIIEQLRLIIKSKHVNKSLYKLINLKDEISANDALKLAKSIANVGDLFSNSMDESLFQSPRSLACILVHGLLLNGKSDSNFYSVVKDIVQYGEPITFVLQCFYEITSSSKNDSDRSMLTDDRIKELNELLVLRIKSIADTKVLYLEFGKEAEGLIWHWDRWGSKTELRKYLQSTFDSDPKNVLSFLMIFTPIEVGVNGDISTGRLRRETFDEIIKLVDPKNIIDLLKSIYGDDINKSEKAWLPQAQDIDDNKRVALEFAAYYYQMLKEQANNSDLTDNRIIKDTKEQNKDGN